MPKIDVLKITCPYCGNFITSYRREKCSDPIIEIHFKCDYQLIWRGSCDNGEWTSEGSKCDSQPISGVPHNLPSGVNLLRSET